jgi:hypothetical protein
MPPSPTAAPSNGNRVAVAWLSAVIRKGGGKLVTVRESWQPVSRKMDSARGCAVLLVHGQQMEVML